MPSPHSPIEASVIVANWQGEEVLARCLSSLQISARASGRSYEIIVVDDASTDGSARLVRERFPNARLLVNERNEGFGATTMRGARAATGAILLLCNNDLTVREDYVEKLLQWFHRPRIELTTSEAFEGRDLFAVSARTLSWWDGSPNQVCMGAAWRGGRITPTWTAPKAAAPCLFVQAGAAAYRRDLFLHLGGLLPLYEPGYWEDYDVSYRAAKRGLVSLYDPDAVALHMGGGSMVKRFGRPRVEAMKARNHLLFEWVNLQEPRLLVDHAVRLAWGVGKEWASGRPLKLTPGLVEAVRRLPEVLRHRRGQPRPQVHDGDLLRRYNRGEASF